jgi:hypothetical protein
VIAQLCPSPPVRPRRPGLPRLRQNDRRSAALLLNCPDGSDGKLDSRLACAYARARVANAMSGQICRCGPAIRLRVHEVLSSLWGTGLLRFRSMAKWNRFGIARDRSCIDRRGGRGFISSKRRRSATAPVLTCRNFFLVPKRLIYFPEFKQFKRHRSYFLRQNNVRGSLRPPLSGIYFLEAPWAALVRKNVAKFPGGGGGS